MFGERLKAIRREKGLSQGDLADRAGINRSYLSMIENGHSSPTLDVVERLAVGMGITLWRLISEVNENNVNYNLEDGFEMYEGLRDLLQNEDEVMLIQPTANEIEMLKGVRFSGAFKPDARFYRDALLAYRRRSKSTSSES